MTFSKIVNPDEWRIAHQELLKKEKQLTRVHDQLAADRRCAPRMVVEKEYLFTGPDGELELTDLFSGRSQLIVYHHMLMPADPAPCTGCSMVVDQIPHLAHLHARNTELVFVSRSPLEEIKAFKKRMGWHFPWYSTADAFNTDFDVTEGFGINVFYREGKKIYRTYFTSGRGIETLGTVWTLLDITPLGRQENWEESPEGSLQTSP